MLVLLREGAWAERQYAQASNLYQVRELMMGAAKGLATLEGTTEARERLTELARRLARTDAPPDTRVVADLLLMRARMDELANFPAEAGEDVAVFVARYADTAAAYKALMGAVDLCRVGEVNYVRPQYLQRLVDRHFAAPGVSEFLEVEGAAPYVGRLMSARLKALDGSTISLPRDTLGKATVLHFWTMGRAEAAGRDGNLRADYERLRPLGLQIVGVNLDADPRQAARFAEAQGVHAGSMGLLPGTHRPVGRQLRGPHAGPELQPVHHLHRQLVGEFRLARRPDR